MKSIRTIFPWLILIACVAGCVTGGAQFDETKVSQIKKGETTEQQLVELFGKPQNRMVSSEGITSLNWMYLQSSLKAQTIIPIVGPFMGGMNQNMKTLTVTLADNKVTGFSLSGTGGGPPGTQDAPQK